MKNLEDCVKILSSITGVVSLTSFVIVYLMGFCSCFTDLKHKVSMMLKIYMVLVN